MSVVPDVLATGLVSAYLEVMLPDSAQPTEIPLQFNPSEYQLRKQNEFAEIGVVGLESPPIQFVRGGLETLTTEILVDTSDDFRDVRTAYTNAIRDAMRVNPELHAPPIVRFVWGDEVFRGVMASADTTFVLFSREGIPIRAKIALVLKEFRPVEEQIAEMKTESPDFEKAFTVQAGDTLDRIAHRALGDSTQWRSIAEANGISDPAEILPGQVLTVPRVV